MSRSETLTWPAEGMNSYRVSAFLINSCLHTAAFLDTTFVFVKIKGLPVMT